MHRSYKTEVNASRNNRARVRTGSRRSTKFNSNNQFPPLLRSFQNQPVSLMKIPGFGTPMTTTVTTGVVAISLAMDTTTISSWASRFASLFEEYRIVGVDMKVQPFSSTTTGILKMYFDEKSAIAPTAASVQRRSIKDVSCSDNKLHVVKWRVEDVADMVFTASTTNYTPVYFKIYTDLANFGAPAVVTPVGYLTPEYWVQFRGYSS